MLRRTLLLLLPAILSAQPNVPTDAASLRDGKRLYDFHCAFCHGKGDDGFGGNLVSAKLPHAPSDTALVAIIRGGIGGTDMPAALGMTDAEMWKVAAHVRALGRSAPTRVPGDRAKGMAAFQKQCRGCHMIDGVGGRMGPDLSAIGAMRSPSNLRASITDPSASISPSWIFTSAETKAGQKINGVRVNEDTFSILIRDGRGVVHSLAKSDLKSVEKKLTVSGMPAFKSMSASDLDDLVAYLFSLRGDL